MPATSTNEIRTMSLQEFGFTWIHCFTDAPNAITFWMSHDESLAKYAKILLRYLFQPHSDVTSLVNSPR